MTAETEQVTERRLKLTIAYDGTAYSGWQLQPDQTSIQETIEQRLSSIVCHPVRVNGSGRTDAGVHARGQVAHVDVRTRISNSSLMHGLNARLPDDIRILKLVTAKPDFDARRSAHGKEYRYFVWNDSLLLPDRRLYITHHYRKLDAVKMAEAAQRFVGRHDFAAFSANPHREIATTVRTITSFTVKRFGKEIRFSVKGEGFLYKQVRSMVGFLLRVGEGREPIEAVSELLRIAEPRTARVPSAPAQGLFLWRVWYKG